MFKFCCFYSLSLFTVSVKAEYYLKLTEFRDCQSSMNGRVKVDGNYV